MRNSLKHNRRTDIPEKSLELVCIEIEPVRARPFLIFAWYRPPSAPVESFKKLEGNLEFFDRENKEMIILGDTNCDFSLKVADEYSSSLNNTAHLVEIYDLFGLTQMIGEPTRVTLATSTLIDHIATNKPENVVASGVFNITLSDHYLVYVTRKFMGSTKRQRKTISTRKLKNFNSDNFLSDLGQIDWDNIVSSSKDINEAVNKWSYLLSLVIEKHAPLTEFKVSDKYSPWLTKEFKALACTRDKLKSLAIKNNSSILMASYRHVRNRVNNLNKSLKREYFSKKIALEKGNLKETWKTLNLLLNKRSKTTNVGSLNVDGEVISENSGIARSMNEFFCSVGSNLSVKIPQQPNPLLCGEYKINESTEQPTEFKFHHVDITTINRALGKMKKSLGFGSDGIASNFLKIAFPVICNSICDIFNFSIFSGSFPESWKIARVAPIFKGGKPDDRSNYRPISVLPVVSRLFEKVIYDQLYQYLDKHKYLASHQSGFRSLHSVVTCLLKGTSDWYIDIDSGKYTAMIFIDLKKAFDTVDHQILLDKMQFYGITGLAHKWFSSYLDNRKQYCRVNGTTSSIENIDIGVPQGSCLGPLLFLLYINDLPFALKKAKATMYADDTAISYSSDKSEELDLVINEELSYIERWLQGNKLSLNVVKTQAMIIGSKPKIKKLKNNLSTLPSFKVGGEEINLVNETKYLGVMIDNCLTWESHISAVQKKISRAIGLLKYAKNFVQTDTLINLYRSITEPHFSYCCSVWGSCGASKLDVLQKLQNKAARIVTNSPFDASAAPLLQRLGWPSVQKLINKETGSMVYKSLNSLAPQYLSDLFVRLSEVHPRELRNSKTNLAIPMLRTGNGQKSFAYRGASLWNSLDLDTKMAPSINAFKSKINEK